MTIAAPSQPAQGETAAVTVTLTDAAQKPLAGETVTVYATARVLSNTGRLKVGEARTNFRGQATLSYSPTVAGESELIAVYAGSERHGGATLSAPLKVAAGALPGYTVSWQAPAPVFAIPWLLIPLLGVWLAFGAALYHISRIPGEVRPRTLALHLPAATAATSD